MILIVIFSMLFLHIIADFIVQNEFMSKFKQKSKWKDACIDEFKTYEKADKMLKKYKFDYIPVLFVHAFSWAFITYLPLLHYVFYSKILMPETWCVFVLIQTFVHMYIDNKKCNKFEINLIVDQLLHFLQILSGGLLIWMLN